VTVCNSVLVLHLIVAGSRSSSLDNLVRAIMENKLGPQVVLSDVIEAVVRAIEVEVHNVGCACHRASRVYWVAAFNMCIVAVQFRKSLLKHGSPDGIIIANMREESLSFSAKVFQRQVIVEQNSVGYAKHIQIYTVDAVSTDLIAVIEEDLLDSTWHFSDSRSSCHDPTITQTALSKITRPNTV